MKMSTRRENSDETLAGIKRRRIMFFLFRFQKEKKRSN